MMQLNRVGSGVAAIPMQDSFKLFMAQSIEKNKIESFLKPTCENRESGPMFKIFVDSAPDHIKLLESINPDELIEFIRIMGDFFKYEDYQNLSIYKENGTCDVSEDASKKIFDFAYNIHKDRFVAQVYSLEISDSICQHLFIEKDTLPKEITENPVAMVRTLLNNMRKNYGKAIDPSTLSKDEVDSMDRASQFISTINAPHPELSMLWLIAKIYRQESSLHLIDGLTKSESGELLSRKIIKMDDLHSMKNALMDHKYEKLNNDLGL